MEIPRQQFLSLLPQVQEAINECDFVSIDTELSGLHRTGRSKRIDTLSNRYAEYKEATERFIIIQFGLCTFKWDEPSGRFLAKPFNFYIFPTSMTGKIQPDRIFMTQAQAFDFLSKQSFDFNKWIYQGIPYLTKAEEEAYVADALRRLNDDMPDIHVDEKEKEFLQDAIDRIEKWIKDPKSTNDADGVNITTRNSYQRRLIYQHVRNNFQGLTADGRAGFIRVTQFDEKQLKKRAQEKERKVKKDCEGAVGFRKVIDMLSESRKLVVGHNMLLDICHLVAQFVQPLPDTVQEFKKLTHSIFPYMVDTKYMCASAAELRPLIGTTTSLDILRFETNREIFKNPRVDMHMEFPRYLNDKEHEAGYDAYVTGLVFLKLHSYLESLANPPQPPPAEEETQQQQKQETDEKKTRGNQGGWDISDDEQGDDPRWLEDNSDNDEQSDVYNYGSIRYPIMDENGQPTALVSRFINKAAMVRTGFECFDFVNPEVIDATGYAFHVTCTSGDLPIQHICNIFAQFGKSIVDPTSHVSAFVIYEHLDMDSGALKEAALHQLGQEFTVETAAEYLAKQK